MDKFFVLLENVIIKDYIVLGIVKVKNIIFEKKVLLRCIFDFWEIYMDVELKYVFYLDINIMFDMFLFEFEVFINFD